MSVKASWRCPRWSSGLSITAILKRARMTPSLSISPENAAAAAGWQCRFNKCPWRAVCKGTNRLEPQTQCLVMAANGFPFDVAGSPGTCYTSRDAHSLCFTGTVAGSVPSVRARSHDHCDLISAQIDGQTTVINPGRWPAARPPGVQLGGLSETSSCWYLNTTLLVIRRYQSR